MRYREQFERDNGYRFFREDVSVLVQALAYGRRLSEEQLGAYVAAVNRFLDAVSERDIYDYGYRKALSPADFPNLVSVPFYKYVSEATWNNYIKQGSFLFGSAEFYRAIEEVGKRDQREGAATIHLAFGGNQLHASVTSGFNCAVFCGTGEHAGDEQRLMLARFGDKLIKIGPIEAFCSRVAQLIGADRFYVYDVVYSDLKNYTAELNGIDKLYSMTGGANLTEESLREINTEFFNAFYEFSFMPSLFAKPRHYHIEKERRVIFEMPSDLKDPKIVMEDSTLVDFVTVVDVLSK